MIKKLIKFVDSTKMIESEMSEIIFTTNVWFEFKIGMFIGYSKYQMLNWEV